MKRINSNGGGVSAQIDSDRSFKRQSIEVRVEGDLEFDDHKVEVRLKQISFGKNTRGYDLYTAAVPK
jgi:hypothetical protein